MQPARADRHGYFEEGSRAGGGNIRRSEQVSVMGKGRVVRPAVSFWIAWVAAPVDSGSHGTIHKIAFASQDRGVAAIKTPATGAMTCHRTIEAIFQQVSQDFDLLLHHRLRIFDQIGLKEEIVAGQ